MTKEKGSSLDDVCSSLNALDFDIEIITQKEKEHDRKIKELAEIFKSGDAKKIEQCAKEIDILFEEVTKIKEQCLSYEKDLNDISDIVLKQKQEIDKIGNFVKDIKELLDKHSEHITLMINKVFSGIGEQMQTMCAEIEALKQKVDRVL